MSTIGKIAANDFKAILRACLVFLRSLICAIGKKRRENMLIKVVVTSIYITLCARLLSKIF